MMTAARIAGREIFERAQADDTLQGMGTTLTALLFREEAVHYAHAGDSRAYLFRDGRVRQLTDDHSWIAEQIRSGAMSEAEARGSKFRHIITRSVGFERDVQVDTGTLEVQAGDCFLVCSDGMSNYVDGPELERILAAAWFRRAPQLLVDVANERGGDDNVTVIAVYAANDAAASDARG
jgi:protein phosphatase